MESPRAFGAALALTCGLAVVAATAGVMPSGEGPVALIGGPSGQSDRVLAIAQAGGSLVRTVGETVAVAIPGGPDFLSRLRSQGYWLIVDAGAIPGCSAAYLSNRGQNVR